MFYGTKNSKVVKERNTLYLNQRYATDLIQDQIVGQIYYSYKSYQLNKTIVAIKYQNLIDSRKILNVSLKRYKVGKSNLLETIDT